MYLSRLRLLAFRIYREAAVELRPGVNLVLGRNGQGKTSLVEAVATLALTTSPRSATLAECASWGETRMGVAASLTDRQGEVSLEIKAEVSPRSGRWGRRLRVGGERVGSRELLGRFRVVLFWPEDLFLIKGGAESRRRMLDVVLSQLVPGYAESAVRYRRTVEQRSVQLRRVREGAAVASELAPWDRALVEHGAVLIGARARYLDSIQPAAAQAMAEIGEPGEDLTLSYRPGLRGAVAEREEDLKGCLWRALAASAREEILRGHCLVGPHRDDFEVLLRGRPARQFASQGQQRSCVLALKVAEVGQHRSSGGEAPLLLLDDVLSELDQDRRGRLWRMITDEGAVEQTVVTATEDPRVGGDLAQVLQVDQGRVAPARLQPARAG
ncbi:MAG: DNA replication/repair protein RecF [Candidatus Dormibacteria bacterium]